MQPLDNIHEEDKELDPYHKSHVEEQQAQQEYWADEETPERIEGSELENQAAEEEIQEEEVDTLTN